MIMEKAKVYFTDFRTKANGDGLPTKLKKTNQESRYSRPRFGRQVRSHQDAFR